MVLAYLDASAVPGKSTAESDVVDVRILEIEPGSRLVQAVDFVSDDPDFAGTMVMTWSVTDVNGASRVDIVAEHVPPVSARRTTPPGSHPR